MPITEPASQPAARAARGAGLPARAARRLPGWLIVAVPVAAALVVGGYRLGGASLWRDEAYTLAASQRPFGQILGLLLHVDAVHGPYYLGMHVVIGLLGTSAAALRLPSLLATSLAAGGTAALGWRLARITALPAPAAAGLLAGLLYVAAPQTTYYAQDARPYGLVSLFAVAASYLLVVAIGDGRRRWWAAYAAAIALTGVASLFALLLLAAHGVTLLVARARQPELPGARLRPWLAASAVAVAVLSPLIVLGYRQDGTLGWVSRPGLGTVASLVTEFAGSRPLTALGVVLAGCGAALLLAGSGRAAGGLAGRDRAGGGRAGGGLAGGGLAGRDRAGGGRAGGGRAGGGLAGRDRAGGGRAGGGLAGGGPAGGGPAGGDRAGGDRAGNDDRAADDPAGGRPRGDAGRRSWITVVTGGRPRGDAGRRPAVTMVTVALPWLVLPPVILLAVSVIKPVYVERYVVFCQPALALLCAAGLAWLARWIAGSPAGWRIPALAWAVPLVILALAAALLVGPQRAARLTSARPDNLRGVSAVVAANERPGDAVFYLPSEVRVVSMAYPAPFRRLRDLALAASPAVSGTLTGTQVRAPVLARRFTGVRRMWLIQWADQLSAAPSTNIGREELALLRGMRLVRRWTVQSVVLSLYAVPQ
jgi:mannosyltransferase